MPFVSGVSGLAAILVGAALVGAALLRGSQVLEGRVRRRGLGGILAVGFLLRLQSVKARLLLTEAGGALEDQLDQSGSERACPELPETRGSAS